jgi:hypothetical protein
MPEFAPKHGVPYTQEDAEVVCPAILKVIEGCEGVVNKVDLVAAARRRGSPLRPYVFNKKTADAAEAYYRSQAGKLLRSFEVTWVQDKQPRSADLVTYVVLLPTEDDDEEDRDEERRAKSVKKGYVSTTTMLAEEKYQQQVVANMQQDMANLHRDYEDFKHLIDFRTKYGRVFKSICKLFGEE